MLCKNNGRLLPCTKNNRRRKWRFGLTWLGSFCVWDAAYHVCIMAGLQWRQMKKEVGLRSGRLKTNLLIAAQAAAVRAIFCSRIGRFSSAAAAASAISAYHIQP